VFALFILRDLFVYRFSFVEKSCESAEVSLKASDMIRSEDYRSLTGSVVFVVFFFFEPIHWTMRYHWCATSGHGDNDDTVLTQWSRNQRSLFTIRLHGGLFVINSAENAGLFHSPFSDWRKYFG
jgi:hypothetical protein